MARTNVAPARKTTGQRPRRPNKTARRERAAAGLGMLQPPETLTEQAYRVMITAHQRGACVIAVFTRDVAETKAKEATELGKSNGYPLFFTTEPEE